MARLKVLNKQEINQLLSEGYVLRYATIYGKVYVQDIHWNIVGAVRFETFLSLSRGLKRLKHNSPLDELYVMEQPFVLEALTFKNHTITGVSNGRYKHSMIVVTNQAIDVGDSRIVRSIAELASDKAGYSHRGYGLSDPAIIKVGNDGHYVVNWWSASSCD